MTEERRLPLGIPRWESNSVDQDGDDWDAEAGPGPFVSNRLRARAILWPHGRSPRQRIMGAEELEELGAAKLLGVVLSGPTSGFDTAVIGKSSKLRMMLSLLSNPSRPECTFGNSLAPP